MINFFSCIFKEHDKKLLKNFLKHARQFLPLTTNEFNKTIIKFKLPTSHDRATDTTVGGTRAEGRTGGTSRRATAGLSISRNG